MNITARKAIQAVINRAWEDDNFKASLIKQPKKVFLETTGLVFPQDAELVVIDQTNPQKTYITIPPKPNFDDMRLSDEQLNQVAGGEVIDICGVNFSGAQLMLLDGDIIHQGG